PEEERSDALGLESLAEAALPGGVIEHRASLRLRHAWWIPDSTLRVSSPAGPRSSGGEDVAAHAFPQVRGQYPKRTTLQAATKRGAGADTRNPATARKPHRIGPS